MDQLAELRDRNAAPKATDIDWEATGRQTQKLLVARAITKSLGGRRLFTDLDLVLSPGSCVGLLGPNGSGKSTLIKVLMGELEPDAPTPEAITAAQAEADTLLEMFAALLRIAQVEARAQRAGFTRVDLSAIAESVAEVYAPAAEERGQRLSIEARPGVVLDGDPALLTQMLANLVENAVRHVRQGGRVAIAVTEREVTVTDDGRGIPEAERERVFRRFHRLDAARSTPGSGLGLALVRAVAGLHGMTVTLGDAAPGLVVRVALPRAT
jgi:signal transduction histidine kinase